VELELDLPRIWSCLAEQMAPVLASPGTGIDLSHLPKFVGQLLEEKKADIFVAEILKGMMESMVGFAFRAGIKPMQPMQLHWAPRLWPRAMVFEKIVHFCQIHLALENSVETPCKLHC